MWKNLIPFMLLSITFASAAPNAADYYEIIPRESLTYRPIPYYDYDYDYDIDGKSTAISPTTVRATTPRPLVRAWNNLVRNVRRNIPRIRWNVTYPVTNLFNDGQSNEMKPLNTDLTDKNQIKKHKNSSGTTSNKNKKPKQPQIVAISEPQEDQPATGTEDMFFLDPITLEYYVIKRVSSLDPVKESLPTQIVNVVDNVGSSSLGPDKVQLTDESGNIQELVSSSSLKPNKVQLSVESSNTEESEKEQLLQAELIKPDEDVQVVEELVDTSDEQLIDHELKPTIILDQSNKGSIRNYIGSYMRDDQLSKRRQQVAYPTREKLSRPRPRRVLYVLRGW